MNKVIVTGAAGFIGAHLCRRLLREGYRVVGYDSVNDYYDPQLKRDRLRWCASAPKFRFVEAKLEDAQTLDQIFASFKPSIVFNLAAQAGVRFAAKEPHTYVQSNVVGFLNVLEACRHHGVGHLLFASTSSVYGANQALPLHESQATEHPLTLYAATKKANEMMAHSYAHLFRIPSTALRFFTVYGPWGRPDMSPMLFANAILSGKPIRLFNQGFHSRSFTHVDDICESLIRLIDKAPSPDAAWRAEMPDPGSSFAPYRTLNIGGKQQTQMLDFVRHLEVNLERKAVLEYLPKQPEDMSDTQADCSKLYRLTDYQPDTQFADGIRDFCHWYKSWWKNKPA